MWEDSDLVFSFQSSIIEQLRAYNCPDIQFLADSRQEYYTTSFSIYDKVRVWIYRKYTLS